MSNPDRSGGLPPFALTDQNGTIQRYVEPAPGIDLAPHVGQVVVVRHDTGRTLLASQLELPAPPLYPMLGEDTGRRPPGPPEGDQFVQQAQYADNDDTTVELLDEGVPLPEGANQVIPAPTPDGMVYPDGGFPVFPGGPMPPGDPGVGVPYYEPMPGDPAAMEWMPGGPAIAPCPQCGGYHQAPGYDAGMAYGCDPNRGRPSHVYVDVEINFLRAHVMEEAFGKLSEKYEFSPRFIAGFTGIGPLDGRVRYWLYDRQTRTVDNDDAVRLEFDVLDLEGTHLFAGQRSDVTLAAGLRFARIELTDEEDDAEAGTDLLGLTLAADGRTRIASFDAGRLAWVYGGRLSILGGDWGGEDGGFVEERQRDDNVVVHELYAGLEAARRYRRLDLRARLAFEMQNWHSDVLAESADTDSIGFIGPGIRVGAEF